MSYVIIRRIEGTDSEFIESTNADGFDFEKYKKDLPGHMRNDEFEMISVELLNVVGLGEEDGGYRVDATVKAGDKEIKETFYVQLTGGEHLPQMGCWILSDSDGDISFDRYMGGIFEPFCGDIIAAAERGYEKDNELNKDGWEFVRSARRVQVSATSSSQITIEKNEERVEDGEEDAYRAYIDNTGFTQPNDYSSMPNFKVEYFDTEPSDELIENLF